MLVEIKNSNCKGVINEKISKICTLSYYIVFLKNQKGETTTKWIRLRGIDLIEIKETES